MLILPAFLLTHWLSAIFFQTFFHHRYASHRMFTMSPGWERFFHLGAFIAMGSSYLTPRAYAILHREHHAYSDTEKDPHTPHAFGNALSMMWSTKQRYGAIYDGRAAVEPRFLGGYPSWPALEELGESIVTRVAWGTLYSVVYLVFMPHWAFLLALPIHWLLGPIHGAIVNWCGHKYGYRNFPAVADRSRNTLPFDFLTMGELFQNNHHRHPMSPDFAARWFEVDPAFIFIRLFARLGIIRYSEKARRILDRPARKPRRSNRPRLHSAPRWFPRGLRQFDG